MKYEELNGVILVDRVEGFVYVFSDLTEAAKYLHVHRNTLWRWFDTAFHDGKKWVEKDGCVLHQGYRLVKSKRGRGVLQGKNVAPTTNR